MNKLIWAAQAMQFARQRNLINKRLLWGILAIALLFMVLVVWAVFALIGQVREHAPGWLASSQEHAGTVIQHVEQVAPGIGDQVGRVWQVVAGGDTRMPEADVGGEDPPNLQRYPGLLRTSYARTESGRSVRYQGVGELPLVMGHYQDQLSAQGYRPSVLSADMNGETREYVRNDRRLTVSVLRLDKEGAAIEVSIKGW